MKKQYVVDFKIGEQVNDVFVISERQISRKRDGNTFAIMTLADKTGQIKAVMWDNVDKMLMDVSVGDFVLVQAYVGEFKEVLQLIVKKIDLIFDEESINSSDFLPITGKDIDLMFSRLTKITDTINDFYIKKLFSFFWEDTSFIEKFKHAPAAKTIHHAYIGGLLEHVLSMALIGDKIASHYNGVNRDLLLAGIILHDFGKINELSYRKKIEYTDEGKLLSHIVIGVSILDEKIKKISNFPKQTELLLKHLIVSHHGVKEFGSPEIPKTIEAILLNCIDDMDFKVNTIRDYIESDLTVSSWTPYNRFMGRHFYKSDINKGKDSV